MSNRDLLSRREQDAITAGSRAGFDAVLTDPTLTDSSLADPDQALLACGRKIGVAITEVLGVIEALAVPTDRLVAHGFTRETEDPTQADPMTRALTVLGIAQTVARDLIDPRFAPGRSTVAAADRIARQVVAALFTGGHLHS